jgi:hypothetical protein
VTKSWPRSGARFSDDNRIDGKKSIRAASNVCSPIELSHDAVKQAEAFIVLYLSIIDSIRTTLLNFLGNKWTEKANELRFRHALSVLVVWV